MYEKIVRRRKSFSVQYNLLDPVTTSQASFSITTNVDLFGVNHN